MTNPVPSAVENFDRLPDSARVGINVVCAITGKSRATIYRWITSGTFPKPKKVAAGYQNDWVVGEIRRALSA